VIRLGSVTEAPGAPESDPDLSRRNIRLGAIVVAVLVGVVGLSLIRAAKSADEPGLSEEVRRSLEQNGCSVDTRTDEGQKHQPSTTYSVNPPAGGDHDAVPSPAGFYDQANVPTDGHLVHSMEHGFVVVWYQPAGVQGNVLDGLRDLAGRHKWVLVVPRPAMSTPVAATAWHRRLLCPDAAAAEGPVANFVNAFRDKGPEKGFV
jgi:hypothetical protein